MQRKHLGTWTVLGALTLFGVGCNVERTREGRAPDVDVDVDPGRLPRYDVKWADVDVGTREQTITVPVVRVVEETRQITVPYIDVNPPGARDRAERTVTIEVDVPHAGYAVEIAEIRAAHDDLWVVARLTEGDKPAAQVVTRVSDQVIVNVPEDVDVRKVIVGERPSGVFNQQYRFVDSMASLDNMAPKGARVIYRRSNSSQGDSK